MTCWRAAWRAGSFKAHRRQGNLHLCVCKAWGGGNGNKWPLHLTTCQHATWISTQHLAWVGQTYIYMCVVLSCQQYFCPVYIIYDFVLPTVYDFVLPTVFLSCQKYCVYIYGAYKILYIYIYFVYIWCIYSIFGRTINKNIQSCTVHIHGSGQP